LFTWGSWLQELARLMLYSLITGLAFAIGFAIATFKERKDARKYFNTYHDALSHQNVERHRARADDAIKTRDLIGRIYEKQKADVHIVKALAEKILSQLS
jgi:hypothetical protein